MKKNNVTTHITSPFFSCGAVSYCLEMQFPDLISRAN